MSHVMKPGEICQVIDVDAKAGIWLGRWISGYNDKSIKGTTFSYSIDRTYNHEWKDPNFPHGPCSLCGTSFLETGIYWFYNEEGLTTLLCDRCYSKPVVDLQKELIEKRYGVRVMGASPYRENA